MRKGTHSEFVEPSWQSLGTLNRGKARVQTTDGTKMQVPLTGYKNFHKKIQAYPVSREAMTVQLTASSNSAILDLPNVNTQLPPPLVPRQAGVTTMDRADALLQSQQQEQLLIMTNTVSNTELLESIQSITRVMQQQLLFSSKTAEQGNAIQNASLFQEMIKAQEKRDLDPALLAIPMFSGELNDRSQCLDWVSRVKNVCDQSGHSF